MGSCHCVNQYRLNDVKLSPENSIPQLRIQCRKDVSEIASLFDYQVLAPFCNEFSFTRSGYVMYNNGKLKAIESSHQPQEYQNSVLDPTYHPLFHIQKKKCSFMISPIKNEHEAPQPEMWVPVKFLINRLHKLKENDTIRLGRQTLRIKNIVTQQNSRQSKKPTLQSAWPEDFKKPVYFSNRRHKHEETIVENGQPSDAIPTCRICIETGTTKNPLFAPCDCSGSVRFVHIKCLRAWLAKKLRIKTKAHRITLNWEELFCELCSANYPFKTYFDGVLVKTVDFQPPAKPYVVIEVPAADKQPSNSCKKTRKIKYYHIISLAKTQTIYLGRKKAEDNELCISEDQTVSTKHAILELGFNGREIYLRDADSKFGTLVQIKKWLVVRNDAMTPISIQVGSYLMETTLTRMPKPSVNPEAAEQASEPSLLQFQSGLPSVNHQKSCRSPSAINFEIQSNKTPGNMIRVVGLREDKESFMKPVLSGTSLSEQSLDIHA